MQEEDLKGKQITMFKTESVSYVNRVEKLNNSTISLLAMRRKTIRLHVDQQSGFSGPFSKIPDFS